MSRAKLLIRPIDRSLTAKILLAFVMVVLVGIGGVALLANDRTTAAFEHYLQGPDPRVPSQLAKVAGIVYAQGESWQTVGQALSALPSPPDQQVVIVGASGQVLVDTRSGQSAGTAKNAVRRTGSPVIVNGKTVGTLYLVTLARSRTQNSGSPPTGLSPSDRAFLAQVNRSILFATIGAIVAALALAILLARQIIQPLRQLTLGAQRIAHGHLDERIQVSAHDEVGQLADAFNQMTESLELTESARRQLVADVAHELRTPLMVIGTTVEAMQDGVLPTDSANLATIRNEVSSLARLVSDLRDLSLGDVGQLPLEHEPVDLADVLTSVGSGFTSSAISREITLTVEAPPNLLWVLGDEARLRQCTSNLVENALRHTQAGGQITIRGSQERDAVIIQVIDTGEGIAAEHLPYVFERFFRADPSRNRRSGGTGLGLSIVQQIIRGYGGEVGVTSDGLGHGATFSFRLPALQISREPSWSPSLPTARM